MHLSRRAFLKFMGTNMAALAIPAYWGDEVWTPEAWPSLSLEDLPPVVQRILVKAPWTRVGADGYLSLNGYDNRSLGRLPQAQTQFNKEMSRPHNRLYKDMPWGIVLHWYGDRENFDQSIKGYLRGFDSFREVDEYMIQTSAHFLVGDENPYTRAGLTGEKISFLQTQKPAPDGTPYLASHIQPIDLQAHREKKQYFVRALYQLSYAEPAVHSILQDFFDGRYFDQNMRTIAIEIAGYDFDNPARWPSEQKISDVLALVWSLMKRYGILASNLLGHNEIQLGKPDPGKKFLAMIKYLVGVKALVEGDERIKQLVFGQFLGADSGPREAVRKYFRFVHEYLGLVSAHRHVYEWEAASKYWFVYDHLFDNETGLQATEAFQHPIMSEVSQDGQKFLIPTSHEGVDFYRRKEQGAVARSSATPVHLVGNGVCTFVGELKGCCLGKTAMFQHRQADGAQVLSVFSHLHELGDLQVGKRYPISYRVGEVASNEAHINPYLHFAVAYGATWDSDLSRDPNIPLNAGTTWIQQRYLHPVEFLEHTA
jgi:hypothetical protein